MINHSPHVILGSAIGPRNRVIEGSSNLVTLLMVTLWERIKAGEEETPKARVPPTCGENQAGNQETSCIAK